MLMDIYTSYVKCASGLGDYQAMSKTELANGYCDADEAGDEEKRSQYFAALMLRYWYKIYEWQKNSATLRLEIEDFTSWLSDALSLAFQYRRWRDPKDKLYNDPNGPDKVFKRACATIRVRAFYNANLDNRKINYLCDSLDKQIEVYGDSTECLADSEDTLKNDGVLGIISLFLSQGKVLEAMIVDGIAFQDTFKEAKKKKVYIDEDSGEEEKYYEYHHEFSAPRVVRHLREICENSLEERQRFINYFSHSYRVTEEELENSLNYISTRTNQQLSTQIKKTLYTIANTKEFKSLLCM